MSKKIDVHIGRENRIWLLLSDDDGVIPIDTALTAVFEFGDWCIDSEDSADPIEIVNKDGARAVEMQLGLITELVADQYVGYLTISDATYTEGLAWEKFVVRVSDWPVCDS